MNEDKKVTMSIGVDAHNRIVGNDVCPTLTTNGETKVIQVFYGGDQKSILESRTGL